MDLPGRMYTVQFNAVSISALQDLFEINAHTNRVAFLVGLWLGQTSDVGDAAEEILSVLIKSGQTSSGSGGGAYTPVPLNVSDAAAGFTAEINNTTPAASGTIVTHVPLCWNVRVEELWLPPGSLCVPVTGGRRATVSLPAAPADAITASGCLYVFEVG